MGWVNYIVIKDLKIMIQTSRYIDNETFDYTSENINGLVKEMEEFNPEILEKKFSEMTLIDLASLIKITDKTTVFQELDYTYFLLMFLKARKKEFEIISEFDLDKRDDLKKYRVIK